MQEKWVKWNAGLDEVPKKLYLESLTNNKNGLTLVFSNENSTRFLDSFTKIPFYLIGIPMRAIC